MPAGIQGLRGTGQFSVDFRPKNYRELYTLLEPNGNAPLNALLSMTNSESTNDPEYKNFRDELPDRVLVQSGGATNVAGTINVTANDNNKFAVNGAVLVNQRTGEVFQCSADTTGTALTVTRGIGNSATGIAMNDGDLLYIVGYAASEGADTPTPISFDATVASNFTQIFRTAFSVTGTLNHTYLRTGNKLQEAMEKALKLHMSDIERAFIFGKKEELNGSTAQPRRFTAGLVNVITTNVIDAAAGVDGGAANVMSEALFDEKLITNIFAYGSKEKIAFVGPKVASLLQQIGKNRWTPETVEGTYGVSLTRYKTFAGDLLVHLHPQFRHLTGMTSSMIVVDFPYLRYRYLDGRDTQLLQNRQGNGEDATKHEYLTECGLELLQEKVHAYIKGWTKLTA